MAQGWWHDGTVNRHYVPHQRVHVPAAAMHTSLKEAYIEARASHSKSTRDTQVLLGQLSLNKLLLLGLWKSKACLLLLT